MISVPSLLIGSTLIAGLRFTDALLAGFIGFAVVVAFMSLESVAAVEQRLDTVRLAASSFGRSGARVVVGLALGASLLGWFGVQSGVAGSSFTRIADLSWGIAVAPWMASLVLGLFMMLTAVFGFRYLKWLNAIAVPCKILLVGYAVVVAFQSRSFDIILQYRPDPSRQLDIWTAIGLSIGFFSVGGVISPDYASHAATRRDAVLGSVLGLLPAAFGLAACGAMLVIVQHTYDIVDIYARLGRPILALTVLIVAAWTTNVMNAYSSGLALNQLFHWPQERQRIATLIAGVLGSLLAASGILNNFAQFLTLLTTAIPPIAGVLVSDYWIARSYRRDTDALVNPFGVLSWALGVGTMFVISHPLRNVLGMIVAAIGYFALVKLHAVGRAPAASADR